MTMSAYNMIDNRWRDKADSKGTPYMYHIDMGLAWLDSQGAYEATKEAWSIHPLVQDFSDLVTNQGLLLALSPKAILLVIEYRHQANWYSTHSKHSVKPRKSLLPEIVQMLKADKLQNCWNLITYRQDHPNYKWLIAYFDMWFVTLGLSTSDILTAYDLFYESINPE